MAKTPVKTGSKPKPATKKKPEKAVQKPGRKCSVCTHDRATEINTLIHKTIAFRAISCLMQGDDKMRMSIQRHTENCLKLEIAALIQQKKTEQAVDVIAEFKEQLAFAKKLRTACEMYLSDPSDPLKIMINPFAHEIDVSYFDLTDLEDFGGKEMRPKKKTAKLSMLLADVETVRNFEVDKISFKHIDLRSYATDTIKSVDLCIDKFARISGIYQADRENEQKIKSAVQAIRDYLERNPTQDRDRVLDTFAVGRGIPRETIQEHLGVIG